MDSDSPSSGLVSFTLREWPPKEVSTQLWERWRIAGRAVSYPPNVRLCSAFYNTEQEVQRAAEGILQLSQEKPPQP